MSTPAKSPVAGTGRVTSALHRLAGPAGSWLNRATALLLAIWTVHGLLRAALLFRKDAFGFPLVGKADWYIFHALFLDLHWIFLWSLPFLAILTLCARFFPRLCPAIFGLLAAFHAAALVFTVIDHETLRFMGMHFDPGMARTYGNTAAVREVFHFLASDASILGLPYVLFFGSLPAAWLLYRLLARSRWVRAGNWSLGPVAWILGSCALGYLYLYHVWPGRFRMAKLRPFVESVSLYLGRERKAAPPVDSLLALTREYRDLWSASGAEEGWVFPRLDWPYYREPVEHYCTRPGVYDPFCAQDDDGDAFPKSLDCMDSDAKAYPGAEDIPSNGVDEDCDGMDSEPWNFVLFLLESHRALQVGHLRPFGAVDSATPFLDSLAGSGHFWTRAVTSGLPTINALIATHLSIFQHPTRHISSDFTTLRHQAFTATLARHGYATHFFSAADPAWDNQTPWLRQWYQGISYHRSREEDAAMYTHMGEWMRDSLPRDKPFFVASMTKTNHYPFNPVAGMRVLPDSATLSQRMSAAMAYTDSCMRALVDSLRSMPWFHRTLFIALADHGFPLSEHGSSAIGYGLYTENVWVPLVMAGEHPELGKPRPRHDLAAQIDLGPTVLDLAGIRSPNAQMGHSLLSPALPEKQFSFCMREEQAMAEIGPFRWHGAWGGIPREQGEELFHLLDDRSERRNLLAANKNLGDSLRSRAQSLARLHLHVVESGRLWPDSSL